MLENKQRQLITKAFCQLRSWFSATNIPHETSGYLISVKRKNGKALKLNIKDGVGVNLAALNDRDIGIAIQEFHRITRLCGYGTPTPVNRGSKVRGSYGNTPELVSFRHNEFRRVANPSNEQLFRYKKAIGLAVGYFWKLNYMSCKSLGFEKEDLESYALVWTCNYIGLYEVQDAKVNENEKRLYSYIVQRLYNTLNISYKKERNCNRKMERESTWYADDFDPEFEYECLTKDSKLQALEEVLAKPRISESVKKVAKTKIKELQELS